MFVSGKIVWKTGGELFIGTVDNKICFSMRKDKNNKVILRDIINDIKTDVFDNIKNAIDEAEKRIYKLGDF